MTELENAGNVSTGDLIAHIAMMQSVLATLAANSDSVDEIIADLEATTKVRPRSGHIDKAANHLLKLIKEKKV